MAAESKPATTPINKEAVVVVSFLIVVIDIELLMEGVGDNIEGDGEEDDVIVITNPITVHIKPHNCVVEI